MKRRQFLKTSLGAAIAVGASRAASDTEDADQSVVPQRVSCDTFVYGSTPGGIAAALEASRRGDQAVLAAGLVLRGIGCQARKQPRGQVRGQMLQGL